MKYYFISDVHGCYDKMIAALDKAGFRKDEDTLVSVGDPFDRGTQSREVLQYFLSCPNHIFLRGNHDSRLVEILQRDYPNLADIRNGLNETLKSFLRGGTGSLTENLELFRHSPKIWEDFWQYWQSAYWAAEWSDFIVTHAWLPTYTWQGKVFVRPDWRDLKADQADEVWYEATWADMRQIVRDRAWADKKVLVGHWWAFDLAKQFGEPKPLEDFSTYENEHLIAIDGCSNAKLGVVNVYVYETDEKPKLF